MDLLLVRHGESEGNLAGRLQGSVDSPLTPLGRSQAARVGDWLKARGLRWTAAYASPLARARDTAGIIAEKTGWPAPILDEDLREVGAGSLESLTREEIFRKYPRFAERAITDLGDFEEFGGESYAGVQERVQRVLSKMLQRHKADADLVLLVAHGGINFQIVKAAVCVPVPRVCILHWGNCTAALLRFRDRRGTYMAEVGFHVPIELMGGQPSDGGSSGAFR
jgi:broad specificity phosphatase PhoE